MPVNYEGKYTIPYGVKNIADGAFMGCSLLTDINIPNSVTAIGSSSFAFTGLTSVTFPNSVQVIGDFAFHGCRDLASITIPNSLKSIGRYAFADCIGLYSVTSLITVPYKLDETVFKCIDDNYDEDIMYGIAKLFVPIGRSNIYKATTGWMKFSSIAETDTKFKLTYMLDGEVYKSYDIQAAEVITPEPAPYKEGYIFSGWSDIPYLMPAHDVTVRGSFTVDPDYQNGVESASKDDDTPKAYYSVSGHRQSKAQRGLNIIRMSDGRVRKVFVK